jgi:hypothetical protein
MEPQEFVDVFAKAGIRGPENSTSLISISKLDKIPSQLKPFQVL